MESFLSDTIDPDLFQIEDVQNDNACFFRAFANALNYISLKDTSKDIISSESLCRGKSLSDVYQNDQWGFEGDEQETLARELQSISHKWVVNNSQKQVSMSESELDKDNGLMMSVEDLVELTHDISFNDYVDIYKYFAGDIIINNDDEIIDEGDSIDLMEDRWGGYIEQVALSNSFTVAVVVLVPQKFDQKKKKIYNGIISRNKAYKGVRYRVSQIVGKEYLCNDNLPIYLIWKKTTNGPHYLSAYPRDHSLVKKHTTNTIIDN